MGCEAARVAALRGHQVTLLERQDSIGGRVMLAVKMEAKTRDTELEHHGGPLETTGWNTEKQVRKKEGR